MQVVQTYTLPYVPLLIALVAGAAQQLATGAVEPTIVWSGIILILLATARQIISNAEVSNLTHDLQETNTLLSQRKGQLEAAQTLSTFGSWEWDTVTDAVTWSPELYRIFGVTDERFEPSLELYLGFVHPEDRVRVQQAIARSFQTGVPCEFEHRIRRADGHERILFCRGRLDQGPGMLPLKMIGTAQDVTNLKDAETARMAQFRAEQELEKARSVDAFKTHFMNTAAHELNTPLTPIRMQLHMLRDAQETKSPAVKRRFEILDRNVERMVKLVGDVLDATRIQASRLSLSPRAESVSDLIREAVDSYQPVAKVKEITISAIVEHAEPVWVDAARVQQVMANLLSNAIKFTPSGGEIIVHATPDGTQARIEVRDTGRGLTPSEITRLFQPFSQVHDAMEVTEPGTGLGLYVARGLIERHEGKIWAESDGRGLGSRFIFTLPLAPRETKPEPTEPSLEERLSSLI